MRTLLRHTATGLFLRGPETWTAKPEVAYDFRFIERARQFVRLWELEDVELAFEFEEHQSMPTLALERGELTSAA